jgi:hypothetical protein
MCRCVAKFYWGEGPCHQKTGFLMYLGVIGVIAKNIGGGRAFANPVAKKIAMWGFVAKHRQGSKT